MLYPAEASRIAQTIAAVFFVNYLFLKNNIH
jgi:hypothetical protein